MEVPRANGAAAGDEGGRSGQARAEYTKEPLLDLAACIAELLKAPTLSAMAAAAQALPAPTATREEAKALYERLAGCIAANDRRDAVASTLALLRLDGSTWLARMRKDGLLRASRYGYDGGCLKKIVAAAPTA